MEYLGKIIYTEGIKPDPMKIEAILVVLERPQTAKDIRWLLGMVQYNRGIWKRYSHTLNPLTDLFRGEKSKIRTIKWTEEFEKAWRDLKGMVVRETILTYHNFNKNFTI
jgi:hypothetical protein